MPGIVGAVAAEGRDNLSQRVQRMLSAMRMRPNYKTDSRVREGCALGKLSVDAAKAVAESNSQILTWHGEICFSEPDADARPMADRLLALYKDGGAEALTGLNGIYTIAVWDTREKRLSLITDRHGFKKLYYYRNSDTLFFGSEYKTFLGQPEFNGVVSEAAVAEFLAIGYSLDDRTLFRDVKLVPPASILTFRKGQLQISSYWDYSFGRDDDPRSEEECVDEFAERLKTAVLRRATPGMCVQITGGLDSRSLLGTVGRHCPGMDVKTVTLGDARTHDVRFGRQMAEVFGYEHTVVPVPEDFYAAYASEGMARTECGMSCVNFFIFAIDDYLEHARVPAVMNGFLGDSLTGAHLFPALVAEKDPQKALDFLYKRFYGSVFPGDELPRLLRPEFREGVKDATYEAVRSSFFRRDDLEILSRCDYVDLHQRQRRFISLHIDFLSPLCTVLDPYTDNDLMDFLLGLPPRLRIGQKVYQEMIRKHLPEVAKVPRTGSALPLIVSKPKELAIRAQMRFINRILPKLTLGRYGNKNLSTPVRHDYCLRKGSPQFVRDLLSRRDLLEDFLNMDELNRRVDDFMSGRDHGSGQMTSLMTFALWREQFAAAKPQETLQPA